MTEDTTSEKYINKLFKLIGLDINSIPRYGHIGVDDRGFIYIRTRTGGGNRPFYEHIEAHKEALNTGEEFCPKASYNSYIYTSPHFLYTLDDDFDNTYAYFYFKVDKEE